MMNEELRGNKQLIRGFIRAHYTDERLAMLLAHARDGKLHFDSCCCLIGIPTADHALEAGFPDTNTFTVRHYQQAMTLENAVDAENAYKWLGYFQNEDDPNVARRRRLIPIIKAEMKRREHLRTGAGLGHSEVSQASLVPA